MRYHSIIRCLPAWISGLAPTLVGASLLAVASAVVQADDKPAVHAIGVGRISGQVVRDQGGDPVVGAEVTLLLPPPPSQEYYVWPLPLRQTRADAEGKFSFEKLPPGKYRVWANHEKLTSRRETLRGERVEIPAEGEQPKPIELRMRPGVAVTARVKSQATGLAIPNPTSCNL